MSSFPVEVLRSGANAPRPVLVPMQCGALSATFDPENGALRWIEFEGREVIRGIYGAVRNREWQTIVPRLTNIDLEEANGAFCVRFDAHCRREEIDFFWHGEIRGAADSTIVFTFHGSARSAFFRNRIGLCLLHPLRGCVGERCWIETVDGLVSESRFPREIAPHQPFKNVRAIAHEAAPGVRMEARFEGEVFETEDQRNWSDASFKTYGTPLDLPMPVEIARGTTVHQSITLRIVGTRVPGGRSERSARPSILEPAGPWGVARPRIGLCFADPISSGPQTAERLRALRLDHLRVDLPLHEPGWSDRFELAIAEARTIGCALHVAIFLSAHVDELQKLAAATRRTNPPIDLWLVFQDGQPVTPDDVLAAASDALSPIIPNARFAAGTERYFAELNRQRPTGDRDAFPCFSLNPQVHAFDTFSMVENLTAQSDMVETAWGFAQRPIVISPISLAPRPPRAVRSVSGLDFRQMSLFAAAWSLGSLARLAPMPEVHSLTYFETIGGRGVIANNEARSSSESPFSIGDLFPVYHVFSAVADAAAVRAVRTSDPRTCAALQIRQRNGNERLLIANLSPEMQIIRAVAEKSTARLRTLDETSAERAARNSDFLSGAQEEVLQAVRGLFEVPLRAYAFAQIDLSK